MPKQHLTDRFIKTITPKDKRLEFYDQHLIKDNTLKATGVKGLLLRVTKAGNKYFYYSYWYNSKSKRFRIGSYSNISLSDARDKARKLAEKVNNGTDPMAEKRAKKNKPKPKNFEYLANQFKKKHLPKLKPSTQKTYTERIDGEMLPAFKGMPVKNISRSDIIELLEVIAYERNSPYQSNRVRAILSSMFTFAVQRGFAEYNLVKTIKPLGKEEKRDRVLTEKELKNFWLESETLLEPTKSVLKILLLLGQRLGETRRMAWENINNDIWTIPKQQTKANRKHFVPLPSLASQIVESLCNDSPYVFESHRNPGKPLKSLRTGFNSAIKRAEIENIRIHDLRRTAATYMAKLGTDRTILGKILNHKGLAGDNQVTARYDRFSYLVEKRKALKRWSHYLQQIIEGNTEAKIIKMG